MLPSGCSGVGEPQKLQFGSVQRNSPQPGCSSEMQSRRAGRQVSREGAGTLFTFPGLSAKA